MDGRTDGRTDEQMDGWREGGMDGYVRMDGWMDTYIHTVEPQWLEHLRDHGNSFETWVVRATEGNHGTSSGSKYR